MSWWDAAYRSGRVPWDPGAYDGHLPGILESYAVKPCRTIDIGCGTGNSIIWLAKQGFDATGVDSSSEAIRIAAEQAEREGVGITWMQGSFPDHFSRRDLPEGSFRFAMERGFLQHFTSAGRHRPILEGIRRILHPEGLFYSLVTAREGARGFGGPPRWSGSEVRTMLEPFFAIEEMRLDVFTPGEPGSIPAWVSVMRPR